MTLLTRQLGENDRVSIVVYAGAAGLVLPPTGGNEQQKIIGALNQLQAGGSTAGAAGIQLAYQTARNNLIQGGVNRVILCTDGDFNVGVSKDETLAQMAEREAASGVALTVLGFGMGNHNDAMLEEITNRGDGNYAFIDSPQEAHKVLVEQIGATLVTIAKDVKIQVEFNPARVASYRLIGYANRLLAAEDFNNDTKDAGEIGAGHTVTALYEVVPQNDLNAKPLVDPLKYQANEQAEPAVKGGDVTGELLTVKLRYKRPQENKSTRLTMPVVDNGRSFSDASSDLRFAAAVASFGMLLRSSENKGNTSYNTIIQAAEAACDGRDDRVEFLNLVKRASQLAPTGGQETPANQQWPAVSKVEPNRAIPSATVPINRTTWPEPSQKNREGRFSTTAGWIVAALAGYVAIGLGSVLAAMTLVTLGRRRAARVPLAK